MNESKKCEVCQGSETAKKASATGKKNSFRKIFIKGITSTNPVFILLLGLCPVLAVSTSLDNAFGMAWAATFVLLSSNLIISIIRRWVPEVVRIPVFIVIIATFVTIVYIVLQAFVPDLAKSLGIYVPLIVVNCIILGRAEAFASKNSIKDTLADTMGIGIGFSAAILLIAAIRQLFGTGSLNMFGFDIVSLPGLVDFPVTMFILPMGAFLVIGVLLAVFRHIGVMEYE
jgi:electron transport complex protein RnfE